jgi:hypothetical protein
MQVLNANRDNFRSRSCRPVEEKGFEYEIDSSEGSLAPLRALLAPGGINQASATACATSHTITAVTAAGFSRSLGALTFSSLEDVYTPTGPGRVLPTPMRTSPLLRRAPRLYERRMVVA